ncbi:PcfJ domain-containing protein [Tenacibaculum sp. 190524A05c]|uniref:PcfJ-like protein n=1 Tax=Tenacibaculum platacis TaxID=3137852 RepID=A0ABM9NT53_9FLAO
MKTNWKTQNVENRHSSFIQLVEKIDREKNKPTRYKRTIETMLLEFFGKTSKKRYTWKRETFKRLLIHLYNQKCYAILRDYNSVEVVHKMSSFGNKIVRNIEDWKQEGFEKEEQLKSLIQHCFAIYETPAFLESSFFRSDKKYMLWYIQIGRGKSIKELSQMPVQLTSKMAHEFRNAPPFFEANQALRYAQALGFGASVETAKTIGFSRLSIIRESEEEFWVTVVQFFAKQKGLVKNEVDQIIDYLTYKYREDQSFSMKSRTLNALVNQTRDWHRNVYKAEIGEVLTWKPSGIKPLYVEEVEEGKKVVYKTVELLNSVDLYEEGNEMHHCVAEYDDDCKDKACTIFSLQRQVEGEPMKRMVTIEVGLPEREILQAQAKYNEEPDKKSAELIDLWMTNAKIKKPKAVSYETYQVQANVAGEGNNRVVHVPSSDNYDMSEVARVIFWILYFIFKVILFSR